MRREYRAAVALLLVCLVISVVPQATLAAPIIVDQSTLPGISRIAPDNWNLIDRARMASDGWSLQARYRMIDAWNGQTASGASNGRAEVVISWSTPPRLVNNQQVKYNVYRSSSGEDLFQAKNRLNDFAMTGLTITDNVVAGRYYYAAQAVLADGTVVASSDAMEANVVAAPPPAQVGTQPATTENRLPSSGGLDGSPIYLMVEGVTGSISEGAFAGGSHVLDWQWGVVHEGTAAPDLQQLTIHRPPDGASIPLAQAFYTGSSIPKVTLTVCKAQGGSVLPYYRLVLSAVRVAALNVEQGDEYGSIIECLGFAYDAIKVQCYEAENVPPSGSNRMIAVDYANGSITGPEPATKIPASSHEAPNPVGTAPRGAYLTVTGIPGSTTTPVNVIRNAIDVLDFRFGGVRNANGLMSERMTIEKYVDPASVRLVTACLAGQQIPRAVLEISGPGQYLYYRVTLTDVKVVSLSLSDATNEIPKESVELSYGGITIEYRSISATPQSGAVAGPWTSFHYPSN